jgi:hypothetical protein
MFAAGVCCSGWTLTVFILASLAFGALGPAFRRDLVAFNAPSGQ